MYLVITLVNSSSKKEAHDDGRAKSISFSISFSML